MPEILIFDKLPFLVFAGALLKTSIPSAPQLASGYGVISQVPQRASGRALFDAGASVNYFEQRDAKSGRN
jgi:hypothetical protein